MDIKKALQQIERWDPDEMTPLHNKEFEKFLKRFAQEMGPHLNSLAEELENARILAGSNARVPTKLRCRNTLWRRLF